MKDTTSKASSTGNPGGKATFFLGCYSDGEHEDALKTISVNTATGEITVTGSHRVKMAIYQALSADGKLLVSCSAGGLASFRTSGIAIAPAGRVMLGGTPCHVSLSRDGRTAYWADYAGGACGSVEIKEDWTFGAVRAWKHHGDGPNKPRQDRAHCHQALPAPLGSGFYVIDLGLDRVFRYPQGTSQPTAPAGAGPRHLAFAGGKSKLGFLAFELGNLLSSFRLCDDGSFEFLDTVPTLPPGDTGRGYNGDLAAAVRLTPDGHRVVVSNRGENSLVSFDFDPNSGSLSLAARTKLEGSWPRDFAFATETLALVAMERSGDVLSMRYDPATGAFKPLSALRGLFRPVALTPVSFPAAV